jgi:hypothetical protein
LSTAPDTTIGAPWPHPRPGYDRLFVPEWLMTRRSEFLFEPAMDGIDKSELGAQMGMQSLSRRDAFKRFANR